MNRFFISLFFCCLTIAIYPQDIIYSISGEYNEQKIPIDSIVVINYSNDSKIVFDNLPEKEIYHINLTKKSLWDVTGIPNVILPSIFNVSQNSPGFLKISYNDISYTDVQLSVYNVSGQKLYWDRMKIFPNYSININIEKAGIYFIRIETPKINRTFKVFGANNQGNFAIDVHIGTSLNRRQKYSIIHSNDEFNCNIGDSINISIYKENYYATPKSYSAVLSSSIVYYLQKIFPDNFILEVAYPDSVGEIVSFPYNNDTLFCEKKYGEFIYQGDIVLTEEQLQIDTSGLKGAAIKSIFNYWPEGKVYYEINETLSNDKRIINAISEWEYKTSLEFIERSNQANYIEFIWDAVSTSSYLGMIGGKQLIKIADWASSGSVIHEIGHAVGLIHEHSRTDRDNYIYVDLSNIKLSYSHNYRIDYNSFSKGFFDFKSIMMYPCYGGDFALNNAQPVITKLDGSLYEIQRSYLSEDDIKIVEYLYPSNNYEIIINVIDVDAFSPVNPVLIGASNAKVKFLDYNNPNRNVPLYEGITDSDGKLILPNILPDDYFVYIEKRDQSNVIEQEIINGQEIGYIIIGIFMTEEQRASYPVLPGQEVGDPRLLDINADGTIGGVYDKAVGNEITVSKNTIYTLFISEQ